MSFAEMEERGAKQSKRLVVLLVAVSLFSCPCLPGPARADNSMEYQLLTPQAAAALPRNRGSLGMDIKRAQEITDGGMASMRATRSLPSMAAYSLTS